MDFTSYLNDIAKAIQAKKKDDTPIRADKFAEEIESIETGKAGAYPIQNRTVEFGGILKKGSKITLDFSRCNECKGNYQYASESFRLDDYYGRKLLNTVNIVVNDSYEGLVVQPYGMEDGFGVYLTTQLFSDGTLVAKLSVGTYDFSWVDYWTDEKTEHYLDTYEELSDEIVLATNLAENVDYYIVGSGYDFRATRSLLDRLPIVEFTINKDIPEMLVAGLGGGTSDQGTVEQYSPVVKIEY